MRSMKKGRFSQSDLKSEKLVIGIGNDFRGDDVVGLYIVRKLREMLPGGIEIIEASGEATELMMMWEKRGQVIVVDAISSGGEAGTVFRFDIGKEDLPAAAFENQTTHSFGLAQAIQLGKMMGNLPRELIVYGIEGKSFDLGESLSPQINDAAEDVIRRIMDEIERS